MTLGGDPEVLGTGRGGEVGRKMRARTINYFGFSSGRHFQPDESSYTRGLLPKTILKHLLTSGTSTGKGAGEPAGGREVITNNNES